MADLRGPGTSDAAGALRRFAPFSALSAAAFLLAALVLALTAGAAERTVHGAADGPTVVLSGSRGPAVTLFGTVEGGQRPSGTLDCALTTSSRARADGGYSNDRYDDDGRTLYGLGEVRPGWDDGDSVTCAGAERIVAVSGSGPGLRLAAAGLCAFVGAVALLFALLGLRARRRAPR